MWIEFLNSYGYLLIIDSYLLDGGSDGGWETLMNIPRMVEVVFRMQRWWIVQIGENHDCNDRHCYCRCHLGSFQSDHLQMDRGRLVPISCPTGKTR